MCVLCSHVSLRGSNTTTLFTGIAGLKTTRGGAKPGCWAGRGQEEVAAKLRGASLSGVGIAGGSPRMLRFHSSSTAAGH